MLVGKMYLRKLRKTNKNKINRFTEIVQFCKALKLNYNTQSSAHYNFNIQYNYFKSIGFNSLDPLLAKNNIDFGDFNRAWYHIEEDYNNR